MSRKIVICKGIFIKNTSFNFLVFSEFTLCPYSAAVDDLHLTLET